MCVAVDSNCMHAMQYERVSETEGAATAALHHILETSYIALDSGQLCAQEWLDCMPGPFGEEVRGWIDTLIVKQKIRLLDLPSCPVLIKKVSQDGLPKKDQKWVKLCMHNCVKFLVTEDIDFFDPKLKKATTASKQDTKNKLSGDMRKLIRRETGAEVICLNHVPTYEL